MPTRTSKPLRIFVGAAALVLGLGMMAKTTLAEPTSGTAQSHDHGGHDHGGHDHAGHDHAAQGHDAHSHDHAAHDHAHGGKADEHRSEAGAANNNADQTKDKNDKKHKHD